MAAMMLIIVLSLISFSMYHAENSPEIDDNQPSKDGRLYRAAGEPCNADDFKWYPVEDEPTKFLHCDRSTTILVEGRCNVVQDAERIFDEGIERCVMASSRKRRSAGVQRSSGLREPCMQNTDCLDNMYCPAGICECLVGYFARNQECVAAVAPGETGCDDDTVCRRYWPTTRCNRGQCECMVPDELLPNRYPYYLSKQYTASPQRTAEGIVCVLKAVSYVEIEEYQSNSFCPLPIPIGWTAVKTAGGPAVFNVTGLVCTVVNGTGAIELNGEVTTSWSDMVISVPTSNGSALCCPNRAHTCMQPKPSGQTNTREGPTRYWYNQATGGCETFHWDGNTPWANNFNTEEHCLSYCGGICRRGYTQVTNGKSQTCDAQCTGGKECRDASNNGKLCCQSKTTICGPDGEKTPAEGNDPAGVGPPSHSVARWRYDQGRCFPFQYTGWGGNYNNFATKNECDRFCVASVCQHGQPLKDANGDLQPCGQGCPSSYECSNGFCCPKRQAVCVQPQRNGTCFGFTKAYWYNAASRTCEEFRYSGCGGGNDNNFESYDDCMMHCRGINPVPRCRHGVADKDSSGNSYTCTVGAVVTGCRENYECYLDASIQMAACCPRKIYSCSIAPNEGTVCGISSTRWYFNASSELCERFTYNGCDGNSNNFATLRACEKYCGSGGCPFGGEPYKVNGVTAVCSAQDDCPSGYACDTVWIGTNSVKYCCQTKEAVCRQPQSEGTRCGAESQRYYYSDTGRCLSFTYLGCDGNENNFEMLSQCNNFCGSVGCSDGEVALMHSVTDSPRTCNPLVTDNCPSGYACRKHAISNGNICCGSTVTGCNQTIALTRTDAGGRLTSPDYPDAYKPNINCKTNLVAPQGYRIFIYFNDLRLERQQHGACLHDYLMIEDGGSATEKYCGTSLPPGYTSTSNRVVLTFKTDGSDSFPGYDLTYTFTNQACGGVINGQSGTISSPDYPNRYPPNLQCNWVLKVHRRRSIRIKIVALSLSTDPRALCSEATDSLTIFKGETADYNKIQGTLCSETSPVQVLVDSSSALIRFVSYSQQFSGGSGFQLKFEQAMPSALVLL